MNIVQSDLKLDILNSHLPIKSKEKIRVKGNRNTKSFTTRRHEGESTIDLLNEYLGTFQSRKIKTEQSLKYFVERCIKNENKVRSIKKLYNSPNNIFVSENTVDIILKDIIELKGRFLTELKKRCVTRKEYRERIGVTYKLIADFIDCTDNIDILEHIFLDNTK